MRAWRYLSAELARAWGMIALVATTVLVCADAMDPTATRQSVVEMLPRALWLAATGTVIGLALAPGSVLARMRSSGAAHAIESTGVHLHRVLLLPVLFCTLTGASVVSITSMAAERASAVYPGSRPQPLDVLPWGAPLSGCWRATPGGMLFERARNGTTVCASTRRGTLPVLLTAAALIAGPLGLGATSRARIQGVWPSAVITLLSVVAAVVIASHLLQGSVATHLVALSAAGIVALGTTAGAWVGQAIGSRGAS